MGSRNMLAGLLMLLLLVATGCGSEKGRPAGGEPAGEVAVGEATPNPAPGQGAATPAMLPMSDKALVQVLFYGLMVLETDKLEGGELSVHLRRAPGHRAVLSEGMGRNGRHTWKILSNLAKVKEISFNLEGRTARPSSSGDLGNYPSAINASDARWMLGVKELEWSVRGFNSAKTSPHVVFGAGTLETCGLVHERGGGVCRVRSGGKGPNPTVVRSMAEYMVVRHEVASDFALQIQLDDKTIEVAPTVLQGCTANAQAECVLWGGKAYGKVFDVAIRNIPTPEKPADPRTMTTRHASQYLFPLFPGAANSWNMGSPDCDAKGNCKCAAPTLQPACFEYFSQFGEVGKWREVHMMSGTDRPICPLVEYP